MIFSSLQTIVYRVHQPKWSFAPTSGAGAGTHGGRANRPGVNALYLSEKLETALAGVVQKRPFLGNTDERITSTCAMEFQFFWE